MISTSTITANMSWRIILIHVTVACVTAPYLCKAAPTTNNNKHGASSKNRYSNILLRESVKTLLGFQDLPKRDTGIISNPYNGKLIPKYMLDLFERCRNRNVPTGSTVANTVRSVYSQIGKFRFTNTCLVLYV